MKKTKDQTQQAQQEETQKTEFQDDAATQDLVIVEKLLDAEIPGFQAEFDPDEAERLGAFIEDALSEEDALDSHIEQP